MTKTREEIHQMLLAPLPEEDVEWRVLRADASAKQPWAMVAAYTTARGVMRRLDECFGPGGWSFTVSDIGAPTSEPGLRGALHVSWPPHDSKEIHFTTAPHNATYEDVCAHAEFASEKTPGMGLKGAASGALKRCAVHVGIGRYFYDVEEQFVKLIPWAKGVRENPKANVYIDTKTHSKWYWIEPELPAWAKPGKVPSPAAQLQAAAASAPTGKKTPQRHCRVVTDEKPKTKKPSPLSEQAKAALERFTLGGPCPEVDCGGRWPCPEHPPCPVCGDAMLDHRTTDSKDAWMCASPDDCTGVWWMGQWDSACRKGWGQAIREAMATWGLPWDKAHEKAVRAKLEEFFGVMSPSTLLEKDVDALRNGYDKMCEAFAAEAV